MASMCQNAIGAFQLMKKNVMKVLATLAYITRVVHAT